MPLDSSNSPYPAPNHSISSSSSATNVSLSPSISDVSSPKTTETTALPSHVNIHPMLTRAKDDIFKPKAYFSTHFTISEPSTFKEAQLSQDWTKAMQSEYQALVHNHAWSLVDLPHEAPIIGCKWVFKIKTNPDGSIARHKARLVAKGYSQTPGLDYTKTFSPVVKPTTI